MKNIKSSARESDLQEISGEAVAAGMAEKLRRIQDVASKHGFNFLAYMLDMARAEAESLRNVDPVSQDEKSKTSS